jgi:hypothetical protein
MPSPFPGMNPYLEQEAVWLDFHERLCPTIAEHLTPQVRPGYVVRIDEHVYIHELPGEPRHLAGRADVSVARREAPHAEPATATALAAAPARVQLPAIDVERISFVEIRDRLDRRLIAVIEVLSPTHKYAGPDREQYLTKRGQILASGAHLVEIDLLRGGPRLPMENSPACAYYVLVSRAEERPLADLWPIALRQQIPVIPIPLSSPHSDAQLDLQALLHRIYDAAGYEDDIYAGEPHPRLAPEDDAWARSLVPARS